MSTDTIDQTRQILEEKQSKLEVELKDLVTEDPLFADNLTETSEPGTDSWRTEAHSRLNAAKLSLEADLGLIKKALERLETGEYGECESCGNRIEPERLKIMPETPYCIQCSKLKLVP